MSISIGMVDFVFHFSFDFSTFDIILNPSLSRAKTESLVIETIPFMISRIIAPFSLKVVKLIS